MTTYRSDTDADDVAPAALQQEYEEPAMPKTKSDPPAAAEPVYQRAELLANARAFGVSREVLAGALRLLGKDAATRAEITEAVQAYRTREV